VTHLRNLQQRFQDYLIGVSEDIEKDIVSTGDALAEHRLGAYYNAYRIRLIDCLAVDYSALEKYLGREAFEYLALDYLGHYPSTHPSVRWFGRHLPEYLRDVYRGDEQEFLYELASYEWAQTLVFDTADSDSLVQLDDIAALPPEAWPELGFRFKPAMRWLDLYWNVPPIENALDGGAEPPPKQRGEHPRRWLLWRRDLKTHWRSLEVHEAWAIEQAVAGADFAAICEGLLEWIDAEQVALVAAGFMKQWIGDQMLLSLQTGS
jgi:hypothetical protein